MSTTDVAPEWKRRPKKAVAEVVSRGLHAVVCMRLLDPTYGAPTKSRLITPEARRAVSCAVRAAFASFLQQDVPGGTYRAATLRSFDPRSQTWSIWWLDARNPSSLDVPVVGRFEDAVGTFLAEDSLDGKPILVRFRWTVPAPDAPRWEQAFSPEGGQTWETNWIMEFSRRAPSGA